MQRSLAPGAVLSLAFLTFALTQNSATPAADVLVLEQNGDTLRWQHMWPRIAKMFDMDIADPVPFLLTTYLADKRPMWDAIVKRENLRPIPYEQIVAWGYGDFAFRQDFDNVSSTIKVRQAGFHECIDSETMFSEIYGNLRERRILPRLSGSISPSIAEREVSAFDSERKVS